MFLTLFFLSTFQIFQLLLLLLMLLLLLLLVLLLLTITNTNITAITCALPMHICYQTEAIWDKARHLTAVI